jgi:hypothetical protein
VEGQQVPALWQGHAMNQERLLHLRSESWRDVRSHLSPAEVQRVAVLALNLRRVRDETIGDQDYCLETLGVLHELAPSFANELRRLLDFTESLNSEGG